MEEQALPLDIQLKCIQRIEEIMTNHGQELLLSLIFLIGGLLIVRWVMKLVRLALAKLVKHTATAVTIANVIHVLLLSFVLIIAAAEAGIEILPVFRLLMAVLLVVVGLLVLFRPYIPTLPFRVGQTIKAAGLLGKVEGTTFLNTRIRTFDGKVFFVPNTNILNDIVINYHYTPTRRMKIDIPIRYDQDILKAKQVLEAVMIEDPRVKKTPRPAVWVLDVTKGCILLGGRCWADNLKYWATRVDLIEKAKLRFDQEGIEISYPHFGIHHFDRTPEDARMEEPVFAGA
ncbi:hypothetical protein D3OALGA1CA_1907 [Olavius algarvensis associated proteobacterium Delta 3]|nr:hypothetical protein D3OALGA1CA_1907 [Olavius algarvensis associated proteobacterium Delta 3]CAB5118163.1 hypothetical protein D3OALGB2SA_2799 [Olavius algarvensis associated proteobacterium Delta 3]